MDIKNSKEIITEFVSRSSFTRIYSDPNLPFNISDELSTLSTKEGLDFLFASSLIGNRVIGFFEELPYFKLDKFFRGDCIIILLGLPKIISAPTLFCRKIEDLPKILNIALKLTTDVRLPVVISISHNVLNNFAITERYYYDLKTIPTYLSKDTFTTSLSTQEFSDALDVAQKILTEVFTEDNDKFPELSFRDPTKRFFNYLLPQIFTLNIDKKIAAYKDEIVKLKQLFTDTYNISPEFSALADNEIYKTRELLCPGCPFVNIFVRTHKEDVVYFTDIKCQAVIDKYKLTYISIDSYFGLLSRTLNAKTLMIARASSYKPHYERMLKAGNIILLNDISVKRINGFLSIKHPKKIVADENILFPYSCFNIKKYGKVKIKKSKCKCVADNATVCTMATHCSALYIADDTMNIDNSICTACMACASICKNGAIV